MPSTHVLLFALTLLAALGSALVAGIFLAFSNFVMRALARVAPASGISVTVRGFSAHPRVLFGSEVRWHLSLRCSRSATAGFAGLRRRPNFNL